MQQVPEKRQAAEMNRMLDWDVNMRTLPLAGSTRRLKRCRVGNVAHARNSREAGLPAECGVWGGLRVVGLQ
jgi:hypothetical protein